jgi:hypothetical protein
MRAGWTMLSRLTDRLPACACLEVFGKKIPAISKFLLTLDVYALPWTAHLEQLWLVVSSCYAQRRWLSSAGFARQRR